jgi:hypothetical protein
MKIFCFILFLIVQSSLAIKISHNLWRADEDDVFDCDRKCLAL